ncbi:beta-mannosidase [Eurytemora carolleeae]|uniref:beta-mannosidase n=1 Tax=Eurytemora carolleeae TaxID=1294199 RepID=UPI000C7752B1|nr:beta-mannosidase [Eurytemora carolleeae]|eukprot:XP_023337040.1 beta-mannosidase-like [Eurytemora affinis]
MNWIKDWWIKSFFLCCLASTSSPEQVTQLDLGQLDWTLTSSSGTRNISVKGHVPGGVYTDLQTAGIIGDLYFRFNSVEYSWIGETDWIYSADLVVDDGIISKESIELECQGLDTVSSIWLNNERVGTSNNMFVRYIYPIKELLKPGLNRLEFRFKSGVVYAQEEYDRQAKEYIVPPSCVPKQYQGVCHANHIRKMQASFSWDWGPSAPSVGIWKPLHLVAFDNIRFKYVMWDVEEVNELLLSVNLRVIFQPGTMEKVKAEIGYEIRDVFEREVVLVELVKTQDNEMEWSTSIQIPKADVSLWWPNGRGEQILYDVLLDIGVEADTGDIQLMDKVFYEKGLGFRTVELVQDPMEIEGNSFYFKINGEPVFMKVSNWIPGHVLPEKVSKEYIYDLLYSAKEANMNMLRVWGGGIYELEEFYQTADQLGILIWQDMMFACSMYPADQASLFNIRSEIKHQVRRISRHPSIALWAGNNENEAALRGNWYGTDTNFSVYKEDYIRLYVDTVQTEILKEDRSRPFLLSSPSNGNINQQEGFISQNPYNPLYGDVHVYNYRDNNWDPEIYGVPRFCSEYGFQSFPSFELVQSVSQAEDWRVQKSRKKGAP